MLRKVLALAVFLVALIDAPSLRAQLSIEVTGAGANAIPAAIVPFAGEAALPVQISEIIRRDLQNSGLFRTLELPPFVPSPTDATPPNFAEWRTRRADVLVMGSVALRPDARYEVRFRAYDVVKGADLSGVAYTATREQLRTIGHRIADFVYEKITGVKGVFSSQVAFVRKRGANYELEIADYDGFNGDWILRSAEPILSPAWSPDGTRIAYVSFEAKKPVIYIQDLRSRERRVLANFRGSNSAPAWAPDGSKLAVALSRDGGSQLYLINPDGSGLRRITTTSGIDTEPRFSPDGQTIYFTSDRGGSPQIYRMPAAGGEAQRVTFEGSYNVSPRPSPDGKSLAYVTRQGNRDLVALLDLATRQAQVLTASDRDESPSFAPNGRMILYATITGGRGVLSLVSVDGRTNRPVRDPTGDVREPAWGPVSQ